MSRSSHLTLSGAFVALTLTAGCSGQTQLAPQPQATVANPTAVPSTIAPGVGATTTPTSVPATPMATPTPTPTGAVTPTPGPTGTGAFKTACAAPTSAVPGLYSSFFTTGVQSSSGYAQTQNGGFYSVYSYAAATPPPSPTPSASPTTTPTPRAYYVYTGTYAIPSYTASPDPTYASGPSQTVASTTGCAFVITTQDGKPFDTSTTDNTNGAGSPTFASYVNAQLFKSGNATTNLTLTPSGGSGTIVLDNGVSGTITLTSRQQATFVSRASLWTAFTSRPHR